MGSGPGYNLLKATSGPAVPGLMKATSNDPSGNPVMPPSSRLKPPMPAGPTSGTPTMGAPPPGGLSYGNDAMSRPIPVGPTGTAPTDVAGTLARQFGQPGPMRTHPLARLRAAGIGQSPAMDYIRTARQGGIEEGPDAGERYGSPAAAAALQALQDRWSPVRDARARIQADRQTEAGAAPSTDRAADVAALHAARFQARHPGMGGRMTRIAPPGRRLGR